ncbi:MAG TPA: alpha/beta hydrolase [Mycobacteriales bacterium]|jgi:pimeloyl-ACP methyl ester carboxylesterase|nr:alpha/beta hydrolase [Mycobacteriales bacterium]
MPPADAVPMRSLVIHGHKRAFRQVGDGSALLLVHGIGDSSRTWLPVIPGLARDHLVIAPDLLGHGESAKPRADYAVGAYACGMRDLLDMLRVERVTIIGHSLGGGVAAQFAYQFPDRCERVILVGSGGMGREVHPMLRLLAAPGCELVLPLATSRPARWAVRRLGPTLQRSGGMGFGADFSYVSDRYDGLRDKTARRAFVRTLRGVVDGRGQSVTMLDRSYLAAGIPTLLVWGAHDGVVPLHHAAVAHSRMPGSRLVVFGDAGHMPHRDDPARFEAEVRRFLDETEPYVHDPDAWREALRTGQVGDESPAVSASSMSTTAAMES